MKKQLLFCSLLISALIFSQKSYGLNRHAYLQGNQVFCHGDSSYLYATAGCYTNCTVTAYQWYLNANAIAGATGPNYATTTPGLYSCNITMPTCYVYTTDTVVSGMTDTLRVYGEIDATFSLLSDSSLCFGDTIKVITTKSGSGASYSLNYPYNSVTGFEPTCLGYNGNGGTKLIDTLEMAYLPNGSSCTDSNSVSVYFIYNAGECGYNYYRTCAVRTFPVNRLDKKVPVAVVGSNPFCSGDSLQFTLHSLYNLPGETYQWKRNYSPVNGAASLTYAAKLNGSYFATITYAQGCSANTDTVAVTVYPPTTVTLTTSADTLNAGGAPITLVGSPAGGTFSGTGVSGNTFSLTDSAQGNYLVTYTYQDNNGCNATAQKFIYYRIGSGIFNMEYAGIHIQPNPIKDFAELIFDTPIAQQFYLTVTDITGKQVYTTQLKQQSNRIDLSAYPKGIYLFKVTGKTGSAILTEKLVKE